MQACILYLEDQDTHLLLSQKDASKHTNNFTANHYSKMIAKFSP